jgi:hypothetical protein
LINYCKRYCKKLKLLAEDLFQLDISRRIKKKKAQGND